MVAAGEAKALVELRGLVVGEIFCEFIGAIVMQHRKRGGDSVSIVLQQKSVEQRCLVKEKKLRGKDVRRVVIRKHDVVEVDPCARRQIWKRLADELSDFAGGPQGVARIYKEEAPILQNLRDRQGTVFKFFRDQTKCSGRRLLDQKLIRIRLNTDDFGVVARVSRRQKANGRGDAAAYLDDARRLWGADKAIEEIGLDGAKPFLQAIHIAGTPMKGCCGHARFEPLCTGRGERLLRLEVCPGNMIHAARSPPGFGGAEQLDRRNLGIKMTRQNINLELLPDFEGRAHQPLYLLFQPHARFSPGTPKLRNEINTDREVDPRAKCTALSGKTDLQQSS